LNYLIIAILMITLIANEYFETLVYAIALGVLLRPILRIFIHASYHRKAIWLTIALMSQASFVILLTSSEISGVVSLNSASASLDLVASALELIALVLSSQLVVNRYTSTITNDNRREITKRFLSKFIILLSVVGIVRYLSIVLKYSLKLTNPKYISNFANARYALYCFEQIMFNSFKLIVNVLFTRRFTRIILDGRVAKQSVIQKPKSLYLMQLHNYRFEIIVAMIASVDIIMISIQSELNELNGLFKLVTSLVLADLADFGVRIHEILNMSSEEYESISDKEYENMSSREGQGASVVKMDSNTDGFDGLNSVQLTTL